MPVTRRPPWPPFARWSAVPDAAALLSRHLAARLGRAPERIDTQISTLLLIGDEAYKVKKPVRLSFLDYGSRTRRREMAIREVRANAAAGGLYRGICGVFPDHVGPVLDCRTSDPDDDPKAVEWAVVMRRFDQADAFDALLQRDALTVEDVERAAVVIADAHKAAERCPTRDAEGEKRSMMANIVIELLVRDGIDRAWTLAVWAWSLGRLARVSEDLQRRADQGHRRRCHGDLHAANIVRLPDGPVPFDAIEFSDTLTSVDVWYDVSFLVMDLYAYGRPDLAQRFVDAYAYASGDRQGAALLPLFLVSKSIVRVLVEHDAGNPAARDRYGALIDRIMTGEFDQVAAGQ